MTAGRRLTGSQAAAAVGVQPGTWRRYTTPNRSRGGKLHGPAPDGHCDPCGCPWWWESTVTTWTNRPKERP